MWGWLIYFCANFSMMVSQEEIKKAVLDFKAGFDKPFQLKGIFFDMDGVLFDSMRLHTKAWMQTFDEHNFPIPEEEIFLNEGSTALATVKRMYKKYRNEEVSAEFTEEFKVRKHKLMENYPDSPVMEHMPELLTSMTREGIDCWVVTGSAQQILLGRLEREYRGSIFREKMITAHDVSIGKPNPEPYLKAIKKSGYSVSQAIVVENAPMGIESAKAAGLFVVAINTGPLDAQVLKEAGADIVLSGSRELASVWPLIYGSLSE